MVEIQQETQNYNWKVMMSMNSDVVFVSVCILMAVQLLLSVILAFYRSSTGKVSLSNYLVARVFKIFSECMPCSDNNIV